MAKPLAAKFRSGTRAGKKRAQRIRRRRMLVGLVPNVQHPHLFNPFMERLIAELYKLNDRVEELEVRLNNMAVDPSTKIVSYPDP